MKKQKFLKEQEGVNYIRQKNGQIVGSIPPYGYRYIKKTNESKGYYEINEEEAKVVRLIFSLIVDKGISLRGVVKELLKRKIKTRDGNEFWSRSTISRIVSNESYSGITYYNKHYSTETSNTTNQYKRRLNTGRKKRPKEEWIPIRVPAIITKELFDKAQLQVKNNSVLSNRNTKNEYLIKGLLYCGNCGEKYFGTPCHGKTYYRCGNRLKRFPLPKDCFSKSYQSLIVDDLVWKAINEILNDPKIIERNISKSLERNNSKDKLEKAEAEIDKKLCKLKLEEEKWLIAYKEDIINVDTLKEKLTDTKQRIMELNFELENLINKSKISKTGAQKEIARTIENIKDMLSNNKLSFDIKQKITRILIEKIEIFENEIIISCKLASKGNNESIISLRHPILIP